MISRVCARVTFIPRARTRQSYLSYIVSFFRACCKTSENYRLTDSCERTRASLLRFWYAIKRLWHAIVCVQQALCQLENFAILRRLGKFVFSCTLLSCKQARWLQQCGNYNEMTAKNLILTSSLTSSPLLSSRGSAGVPCTRAYE